MSKNEARAWDAMLAVVGAARLTLRAQTRLHGWTVDLKSLEQQLVSFDEAIRAVDEAEASEASNA